MFPGRTSTEGWVCGASGEQCIHWYVLTENVFLYLGVPWRKINPIPNDWRRENLSLVLIIPNHREHCRQNRCWRIQLPKILSMIAQLVFATVTSIELKWIIDWQNWHRFTSFLSTCFWWRISNWQTVRRGCYIYNNFSPPKCTLCKKPSSSLVVNQLITRSLLDAPLVAFKNINPIEHYTLDISVPSDQVADLTKL